MLVLLSEQSLNLYACDSLATVHTIGAGTVEIAISHFGIVCALLESALLLRLIISGKAFRSGDTSVVRDRMTLK